EDAGSGRVHAQTGDALLRGAEEPRPVRPRLGVKKGRLTTRYLVPRAALRPALPVAGGPAAGTDPGGEAGSGLVPAAGRGYRARAPDGVPQRPRAAALAVQAAQRLTDTLTARLLAVPRDIHQGDEVAERIHLRLSDQLSVRSYRTMNG